MRLSSEYGTRHMLSNAMMKENDVKMGNIDKVVLLFIFPEICRNE
jgi:hypothetical protein